MLIERKVKEQNNLLFHFFIVLLIRGAKSVTQATPLLDVVKHSVT
jgi:hypothetical protein